jgi:hypothetical protein
MRNITSVQVTRQGLGASSVTIFASGNKTTITLPTRQAQELREQIHRLAADGETPAATPTASGAAMSVAEQVRGWRLFETKGSCRPTSSTSSGASCWGSDNTATPGVFVPNSRALEEGVTRPSRSCTSGSVGWPSLLPSREGEVSASTA